MRRRSLCLALLVVMAASSAVRAEEKTKIAVLDLRANTEIDKGILKTLNEVLLNDFHTSHRLEVIGSSDIASMLALEEERIKVTGCADDACLVEIGGALGVRLLAVASLGAVGEQYILAVKVLDVKDARVVDRTNEIVARSETELVAAIKRAVHKVVASIGDEPGVDSAPATTAEASVAAEPSTGALAVLPWVGLGLTAAAAVTAGALSGAAMKDAEAARGELEGTSDWASARDSAESKALGADVMFGLTGAFAATTLALFLINALGRDEPAPAAAAVLPVSGGGVASLTVRFR